MARFEIPKCTGSERAYSYRKAWWWPDRAETCRLVCTFNGNNRCVRWKLKGITSFPCICRMVWHMHGAMYRVASIRFTYSSVARHIAPSICHTTRHIHGKDVIPLREVWHVIYLMRCEWQSYKLRRMKDAATGKMLNFFCPPKNKCE